MSPAAPASKIALIDPPAQIHRSRRFRTFPPPALRPVIARTNAGEYSAALIVPSSSDNAAITACSFPTAQEIRVRVA